MDKLIDDRTPQERLLSRLRGTTAEGGVQGGLFLQAEELRLLLDLLAGETSQNARQLRFKIADHVAVCAGQHLLGGPIGADTPLDTRVRACRPHGRQLARRFTHLAAMPHTPRR